jgi:hypothetical protein
MAFWILDFGFWIIAGPALYQEERMMPNTHISPSTSRRDLACSLRGARPRKQGRLRHWLLPTEHLEDRRLLAGSPWDGIPAWHRKDMVTRRLRWGIASILVVVGLLSIGSVSAGICWRSYVRSPLLNAEPYQAQELPAGVIDIEFEVNRPGMNNPPFANAREERIAHSLSVIGLIVNGEAYAYSITALSVPTALAFSPEICELARRHVVNQLLGTTAISVTYCNLARCGRVFRMEDQSQALPLGVGGLRGGRMVLLYAGKHYMQDGPKIPLKDFPYELTTWGDWVSRHPTSRIYLGS